MTDVEEDFPEPRFVSDLTITAANSPYIIDRSHQNMVVQNWTMADNTRIEFAPDVSHWVLIAHTASFGRGVVIDGSRSSPSPNGRNGAPGSNGGKCRNGGWGLPGEPGLPGQSGVTMGLTLAFDRVGEVAVNLGGGPGGNGGKGGKGGDGGRAACGRNCKGSDGAPGNTGGNAGPGGSGGNFHLTFSYLRNPPGGPPSQPAGFRVISEGGQAGDPGLGGDPGEGGRGKSCGYWKRGGGRRGRAGRRGGQASRGREGSIVFRLRTQETLTKALASLMAPDR